MKRVLPGDVKVTPNGVSIVALLPNPSGKDAGHEQVTIGNSTDAPVNLDKWELIDRAGNKFALSGTVAPNKTLVVTMTDATMPLNNDGDEVLLVDLNGLGRSRVKYDGTRSGIIIHFSPEPQ